MTQLVSKFNTDLEDGFIGEEALYNYLEREGLKPEVSPDGNFAGYDMKDKNGNLYEVKFDRLWKTTHNVAIEPQTLEHTKANYFVYKLLGVRELLLLPTYLVRALYRKYPKVPGGDQGRAIALVPVRHFINLASKL